MCGFGVANYTVECLPVHTILYSFHRSESDRPLLMPVVLFCLIPVKLEQIWLPVGSVHEI